LTGIGGEFGLFFPVKNHVFLATVMQYQFMMYEDTGALAVGAIAIGHSFLIIFRIGFWS
jgi:hypothetical protein